MDYFLDLFELLYSVFEWDHSSPSSFGYIFLLCSSAWIRIVRRALLLWRSGVSFITTIRYSKTVLDRKEATCNWICCFL